MKKIIVFVLIMTLGLAAGCRPKPEIVEEKQPKKVTVQKIELQSELTKKFNVTGTATPKQQITVKSLTQGNLAFVLPVGTKVSQGTVLFQISDQNIENSYLNTLATLQQSIVLNQKRIEQAALALNSSKARLESQKNVLLLTQKQSQQSITQLNRTAQIHYLTARNDLLQIFIYLSIGDLNNDIFKYREIQTTQPSLRNALIDYYVAAKRDFESLPNDTQEANVETAINELIETLRQTKLMLDTSVIVLQNAVEQDKYAADLAVIINYQLQVNQHISTALTELNSLDNAETANQLSLDQIVNQIQLGEIEVENATISLQNSKEAADLERIATQRQFDASAYAYNNLTVQAPFSGTVLSTFVENGEYVNPGQNIAEIGDTDVLEVEVGIDTSIAQDLKVGDTVIIEEKYDAKIAEISPAGNAQSGKTSVIVRADAKPDNALLAGEIVEITFTITYKLDNNIVIPISAVTIESSESYVYVLENGTAIKRVVTLGRLYDDQVVVETGLVKDDNLILREGVFITEGESLEITDTNARN